MKKEFPLRGEVTYHKTFNRLEPDFILNSRDGHFKMVVDAKYKPKYENNKISTDDIRQISGYARMQKIYSYLKIKDYTKVISCLVIYSHQTASEVLNKTKFRENVEEEYVDFYKIGIRLPERTPKQ